VANQAYVESVGRQGLGGNGSESGGDGEAVVTMPALNPLPNLRKERSRPVLAPRSER